MSRDPSRVLRAVLAPLARKTLADALSADVVERAIASAFAAHEARADLGSREESWGGRLMMELASLTIGFHEALLRETRDEARARRLTAAVTWAAYRHMARLPGWYARVRSDQPLVQLRRATGAFRQAPFGLPAYVMRDVDAGEDVVAFDVLRCPVAELMHAHGLDQLCVESWCDLDFPLAREWGGWLERELALANGDSRCSFRWHAGSPPSELVERHRAPAAVALTRDGGATES